MNTITRTAIQVGACGRRDARVFLSYHFQLLMHLFGTLITVTMFFFIGRLVGESPALEGYAGGYFEFALLGLIVMGLSTACVASFSESMQQAQGNGTLEILLATSRRLGVLMAGTLIVPLVVALANALAILALGYAIGDVAYPLAGVVRAVPFLLLTLGTFAAIGILSAAVIVLTKRGDPFSQFALQISNLLAGAVFPVAVLPPSLELLARVVPAFYGLHGIRETLLGGASLGSLWTELLVLVGFNVVMLPFAVWALGRAVRTAQVIGTLGNR